jgi:hypothetical protein
MTDRLAHVEARLRELDEAFGALRDRVTRLEGEPRESPGVSAVEPDSLPTTGGDFSLLPLLTLAGRTLLVFGGAYLLRALTDTGLLPRPGGVVLGLAYASAWIGVADRAALQRRTSRLFHGLAALLIACPLLLEASTRFDVLSPAAAAALLTGFAFLAVAVAWHRDLQALAVIATTAAAFTAFTLAVTTGHVLPFAASAVMAAATAELIATQRGWRWPVRPPLLIANLLVLDVIVRAQGSSVEPLGPAFVVSLFLAAVCAAVLVASAISRPDELSILDIAQSLAALVIGLGGALVIARVSGPVALESFTATLLAIGVAGYLLVISRADRWSERAAVVFTTLAAVLMIVGGVARLFGTMRDLVFGLATLILFGLSVRIGRPWLAAQGALFAIVMSVTSGMLYFSADTWTGGLPTTFMPASALGATAILALGGVVLPLLSATRSRLETISSLVLTGLAACAVGALLIGLLDSLDGRATTAGATAAGRTVVLSVIVIALTALSRLQSVWTFKWLAHATLVLGAVKLVAEDMRVSSPVAIFVALAAYGAALIVTARLLARGTDANSVA